ncbi:MULTISPECIES: transposase [Protofrankia]|uniref:transposase n=1 Tax=Protofrankia TaxID=2994361 RepID=UPI000AE54978|nr:MULTISPECIES: transposase [Protofrankia]
MRLVRRAKLFVFLPRYRYELFDEAFQAELAGVYRDSPQGQPPVPSAQLALALILQAYTGVSDDEVIEACVTDRRWQLVLDCLDADRPPFPKGTLVGFRTQMINAGWDRRLIERTIEVATETKGFGPRASRAALGSSPPWGAGRVEDTPNMLGHALRKALGVIAVSQGWGRPREPGSWPARPGHRRRRGPQPASHVGRRLGRPGPAGHARGVALAALAAVEAFVAELHIDRAYLSSTLVRGRDPNLAIFCKAWRVRDTTGRYAKTAFILDFDRGRPTCPAGAVSPWRNRLTGGRPDPAVPL